MCAMNIHFVSNHYVRFNVAMAVSFIGGILIPSSNTRIDAVVLGGLLALDLALLFKSNPICFPVHLAEVGFVVSIYKYAYALQGAWFLSIALVAFLVFAGLMNKLEAMRLRKARI